VPDDQAKCKMMMEKKIPDVSRGLSQLFKEQRLTHCCHHAGLCCDICNCGKMMNGMDMSDMDMSGMNMSGMDMKKTD